MAFPFDVKKYTEAEKKQANDKQLACSRQAISNMIVLGSMPMQTSAPPLQQQPVKQ